MIQPEHDTTKPSPRPLARRVLFVNPPSVVEDSMIQLLVSAQFEAAVVHDFRRVDDLTRAFPQAIFFFSIDNGPSEKEWKDLISRIITDNKQSGGGIGVGVLTYNDDQRLAREYLMDIGVDFGFITVKLGFQQSASILLKALEAAEARGGRRFVRVEVPAGKTNMNVALDGQLVPGQVVDMSIVGMACYFDREFQTGTQFNDIQLRLWGGLVMLAGRIVGERFIGGRRLSVVMFEQPIPAAARSRLFAFVRRVLQYETDSVKNT